MLLLNHNVSVLVLLQVDLRQDNYSHEPTKVQEKEAFLAMFK